MTTENDLTAAILAKRAREKDSWRTKALIGAAIIGMVVEDRCVDTSPGLDL